jgi:hypothetical protein
VFGAILWRRGCFCWSRLRWTDGGEHMLGMVVEGGRKLGPLEFEAHGGWDGGCSFVNEAMPSLAVKWFQGGWM